jgi:predicted CoA-substrate-specific enzyme activase
MNGKYVMGIDIGSTTSKCLLLDENGQIAATSLIGSGTGTSGPSKAVEAAYSEIGMGSDSIAAIVSTGYGRNNFAGSDKVVSELSCHAKGANFLFPDAKTVIDIGGQDAKVLHIKNGLLSEFHMNDKCAAGTGRFLEVMSRVLDIDISEMSEAGARAKSPLEISSTCTVFAESEVISHLSVAANIDDIVAGIHKSVATRTAGLAKRIGVIPEVVMTGGVARNDNVRFYLSRELKAEIKTSPLAQYAGALGAALFALELIK